MEHLIQTLLSILNDTHQKTQDLSNNLKEISGSIQNQSLSSNNKFNYYIANHIMKIKEISQFLSKHYGRYQSPMPKNRKKKHSYSMILDPEEAQQYLSNNIRLKITNAKKLVKDESAILLNLELTYANITFEQREEKVYDLEEYSTSRLVEIYQNEVDYVQRQFCALKDAEIEVIDMETRLNRLVQDKAINWIVSYVSSIDKIVYQLQDIAKSISVDNKSINKSESTNYENSRNSFSLESQQYSNRSKSNTFEFNGFNEQERVLKEIRNEIQGDNRIKSCVQCSIF